MRNLLVGLALGAVLAAGMPADAHHATTAQRLRARISFLENENSDRIDMQLEMDARITMLEDTVDSRLDALEARTSKLSLSGSYSGGVVWSQLPTPFSCFNSQPMKWGLSSPTCGDISLTSDVTGTLAGSQVDIHGSDIDTPFLCSGVPALWRTIGQGLTC
jgi:hypothetical protein